MEEELEKKYWETTTKAGLIKRPPTHPVVEFYCKQRISFIEKFIDFKSIKSGLDIGAGTGFNSYYMPKNLPILNLDFAFHLLKHNLAENKIQSSGYDLPFNSNSFDLVYCWNFLHHLEDPDKAVNEMARVTSKYLVLIEPNRNNPVQFVFGATNKQEHGTLKFTKSKLLKFLDNIGFELITCNTIGWFFAGPTPENLLPILKFLPLVHPFGISNILICKKI